ncbi:hypothetical protein BpHYR1_014285 [Brachionus plicatilis]|uniref:Uncharacterized protein n=1 Tax=Brachionus plicatilis TaxID=10195 RepID=A0A3M7R5I0_BRAPC|nr:hypothetical protein BpHYR1_014285 [Brachionus plicatilis]
MLCSLLRFIFKLFAKFTPFTKLIKYFPVEYKKKRDGGLYKRCKRGSSISLASPDFDLDNTNLVKIVTLKLKAEMRKYLAIQSKLEYSAF